MGIRGMALQHVNKPGVDAHATLSPSGFKKTLHCPGHIYLCRDIPDKKTKYSSEGDVFHDYMSKYSKMLDTLTDEHMSKIIEAIAPKPEGLSDQDYCLLPEFEMASNVVNALQLLKDLESHLLSNRTSLVRARRFIEKKVHLSEYIWGTLDYGFAVRRDKGWEGAILDHKYGKGVPVRFDECVFEGAPLNIQTALYGVGFYKFLKEKEKIELDYIYLYIHQPRTMGNPWEAVSIEMDKLLRFYEQVVKPAEKRAIECYHSDTYPGDDTFQAGEWCRTGFCNARAVCPTYKQYADDAIQADIGMESLPLPSPEKVPTHKLVQLVRNKAHISDYIKQVEEYLYEQLTDNHIIPGVTLVDNKGQTRWRTDISEEDIADKLMDLGVDSPYQTTKKLLTISNAEKLAGKENKKLVRELTEVPLKGKKLATVNEEDVIDYENLG